MKHNGTDRLVLTGLLLIAAALFLSGWNLLEDRNAGSQTEIVVSALETVVPSLPVPEPEVSVSQPEPLVQREMPAVTIDGREYIGTLCIPSLELTLGILSRCSEDGLKVAPCRYVGSVYSQDMVIAAHNYDAHFGRIHRLQVGDAVTFTDVEGNTYSYEVVLLDTLMPGAVAEMTESRWDMTLFTCTLGGASRVTVRCEEAESGV